MPRPTPAQLAYGSATVVLSTFAMLLLSQTRSGLGVAVVTVVGLVLGLLVAVTVPVARVRVFRPGRTVRASRPVAGSGPADPARAHTRAHADSLHG
ncbi:hypothetical protein [Streptomyces rapamycinicus]|uniref:Membrane protein n=2 Tax=Streptomyces rapamycinicus TaxID=1226757 RepID=A0A0A0NDE6_STRRN|nr:hypothetical protein [Streptomyces rapamycinicus]AGP57487.1 membrane protein [Streptomyces rapamycinicus NRRL 5491]MBB4785145.1 hypothetical protein [Streptomyces rapamycinicus]RLV79381.1 membrane protein [Streptomyces rapamycinicus NRRL 5491]UTO65364.1 hypothetical protein LJB45_25605 [Streptomyces rapamycinicus]UTP33320.1 hypothetical protein LIV37_30735 [Streptomyces rapamycinicus NRRL 5491]